MAVSFSVYVQTQILRFPPPIIPYTKQAMIVLELLSNGGSHAEIPQTQQLLQLHCAPTIYYEN